MTDYAGLKENEMSKRRKHGEIVYKPAGYGFSGEDGLGIIPEGSVPDECMMGLGDPERKRI